MGKRKNYFIFKLYANRFTLFEVIVSVFRLIRNLDYVSSRVLVYLLTFSDSNTQAAIAH